LIDQEKIHNQCLNDDPKERIQALEQLENLSSLLKKQQVWNDLHRLTNDEYWGVRYKVAYILGSEFYQLPDKQHAWDDLIKLTNDEDDDVRLKAVSSLVSAFSQVPDKQQAWEHLIRLTNVEDWRVRDKAASTLGSLFSYVPDKQQAWDDLHKLTNNEYYDVRSNAAFALGSLFSYVPDKQQAWNDLQRLTSDEDGDVRLNAVSALVSAFPQVPDKQQAWEHLIRLTKDKDSRVRYDAASVIGFAFFQVPDKQQAWEDLIRLAKNKIGDVRYKAASFLGSLFNYVPNKQQAWNDLIKLTNDKDSLVRYRAANALGIVYSQVPDKQSAWDDLHRLTNDRDSSMRNRVAYTLGSAFSQVPDKQQAWNDLIKLTVDENSLVRTYANHSLGKVSIFKASQSEKEEDYKKELEKAIEFFEIAAQELPDYIEVNPSQFCLPFYRSFHTIIFKKQEAKEEVDRYLAELKSAIEGSKSKESFFEAVESLANALKEVNNLETLDLETKKGELSFYRKYFDCVEQLMMETEKTAPFATITIRKGLPILDRNLKGLIEEIREKANIVCKVSQATPTQEIACTVNREVQKWEIDNQEEMTQRVEDIAYILKTKIVNIPENEYVLSKIEAMRNERNLTKQYETLLFVITQIPTVKVVPVDVIVENINKVGQDLGTKLDGLSKEMNEIRISLKPGMKEEFEISSGIEILGTGAKHIVTIPLLHFENLSSYQVLQSNFKRAGNYTSGNARRRTRLYK
jgi:HEAT repeat protein